MDPDLPPSTSTICPQLLSSGCRSLPPANITGPHECLPSYPSSMMHYYPSSQNVANTVHIATYSPNLPHALDDSSQMPLPSASQSHIPSLICTPSVPLDVDVDNQCLSSSPYFDQRPRNHSRIPDRIYSLSPITFTQPQPDPNSFPHHQFMHNFTAPQPTHPIFPQLFYQNTQPTYTTAAPVLPNAHISSSISSLPSTKDIPLLSGKHNWGPWHSAVHMLILNSNLLGHIADDPLPGASFNPGLSPTYPPVVNRRSSPDKIQSFTDWWSRDGLASHILTSQLTPSVLGCLPIANERMGHCCSAWTVYITLHHQFGAGDYSAVMVIEAQLRQLKCLPMRGSVRITDFVTTWCISINQMEAAGFLPGTRQLLSILADGLPHNTIAFINLYDHIILSLNEPNEQLLPNVHHLFYQIINIKNNIQRN